MKNKLQTILTASVLFFALNFSAQIDSSTIEDYNLLPNTYYDNSVNGNGFTSGNIMYPPSDWDTTYSYWTTWWAASNMTDSVTSGYLNQYSAKTAKGVHGSSNYAVGYGSPRVQLTGANFRDTVLGFYVTNTTYAYNSMRDGDNFGKKFGGPTGNDPDWFLLTVKRWYKDTLRSDSVYFYLADFRFGNNSSDYILKTWQWVNCKSLGKADSLQFFLSSSDTDTSGMKTPAYFAMDDLKSKATMVGINSFPKNDGRFFVFPNPSKDVMNISLPQNFYGEKIVMKVFDLTGKVVREEQINYNPNSQLNISSLETGNYFLQIISNSESKTIRFIKY